MFYEHSYSQPGERLALHMGNNLDFPLHLHNSFEYVFVSSGVLHVTVDGSSYEVREGDALLIFPNQIHGYESLEKNGYFLAIFPPELVKSYGRIYTDKVPSHPMFTPSCLLLGIMDNLLQKNKGARPSLLECKSAAYALCAEFDAITSYVDRHADSLGLLGKIFRFVEENHKDNCSLRSLAEETAYHYVYLSRYFKESVGLSFTEYVNRFRLSQAAYRLKGSDEDVSVIALETGFGSLRSFNRNFKAFFHLSPTEYRASATKA